MALFFVDVTNPPKLYWIKFHPFNYNVKFIDMKFCEENLNLYINSWKYVSMTLIFMDVTNSQKKGIPHGIFMINSIIFYTYNYHTEKLNN